MTVEKANDFMDENLLPDHLLPADSSLKKQRKNKEITFLTNLEMLHFAIMINAINLFLTHQRQSNERIQLESLRHAHDIEKFFKNLAIIDANSHQQIKLKNIQLEQIKSALEKINNSINAINQSIINCADRIKNLEMKLAENDRKLKSLFVNLNNIFEMCKDKIKSFNFNKLEIDLIKLTGEQSGKIQLNESTLENIINEAHNDFHSQHESEDKYDFKDSLLFRLHKHVENEAAKENTNIRINTNHPVLNDITENIIDDMNKIAGCDIVKAFNEYSQIKEEKYQIENEIKMEKIEYESLVQQRNALINARDLCSNILATEKADLNIVKQFSGSIDNLINDLMSTPTPINMSSSIEADATKNKESEPDASLTLPRFGR